MNIKEVIKNSRVKQWEIADKLHISEVALSRMLRYPEKIDDNTIKKILIAIESLLKDTKL